MLAVRAAALLRGGVSVRDVFAALGGGPAAVAPGDAPQAGSAETLREVDSPRDADGPREAARLIGDALAAGERAGPAIASIGGPDWRVLAVAWRLAEESGSPLAPALERIGEGLQELERLRMRREVLLAGPRATSRTILALPPVAVAVGWGLGFDPFSVLLGPTGAVLLLLGLGLLLGGMRWSQRLQSAVAGSDVVEGLEFELTWVALGGGAAPPAAVKRVADAVDDFAAEWVQFDSFTREAPLATVIDAAMRSGIPLRSLLLSEATQKRAGVHSKLERDAERLAVRILLPLGVCVLPAFLLLGVVPVVVSMFGGL